MCLTTHYTYMNRMPNNARYDTYGLYRLNVIAIERLNIY